MDAGVAAAAGLSLDTLASQLKNDTYNSNLKVKMENSIVTIENIPAFTGQPQHRWLLSQFFEAAYRHVPQMLGVVLKDESGRVLASNL